MTKDNVIFKVFCLNKNKKRLKNLFQSQLYRFSITNQCNISRMAQINVKKQASDSHKKIGRRDMAQ